MSIDPISPHLTPTLRLEEPVDVQLAAPPARSGPVIDPDRAYTTTRNPFLAVRRDVVLPPHVDDVLRDLNAALRADPQRPATRGDVLDALLDLQRTTLSNLSPEQIDATFRQLAAAFDTWPDETWARDLVAVAVATLALHLSWKNDGARTLSALAPATIAAFEALARYVDQHAATYGAYREEAQADGQRRAAAAGLAVLTEAGAEAEVLGLEDALKTVIAQTRKAAGTSPADASSAAVPTGVRALAYSVTMVAESRKRSALQQLEQGEDLSQAAIMRLQEDLQAANQLIMAMSQILRKEAELGEQLVRNIA